MYQHKVDVDMLNAVKSMLSDVSNVSSSSEQSFALTKARANTRNISGANTLFTAFSISTSTLC